LHLWWVVTRSVRLDQRKTTHCATHSGLFLTGRERTLGALSEIQREATQSRILGQTVFQPKLASPECSQGTDSRRNSVLTQLGPG
jgi:hypothetical protein